MDDVPFCDINNMTALYEKIANLPPSLLPKVEDFIDTLSTVDDDPDWELPLYDKDGKKVHPKAGCMKGVIIMNDNFFEPDDDWDEYL